MPKKSKAKIHIRRNVDMTSLTKPSAAKMYDANFKQLAVDFEATGTAVNFEVSGTKVVVRSLRTLASRHKQRTGLNFSVTKTERGAVVSIS